MIENIFGQIALASFGVVLCFGLYCFVEELREMIRP